MEHRTRPEEDSRTPKRIPEAARGQITAMLWSATFAAGVVELAVRSDWGWKVILRLRRAHDRRQCSTSHSHSHHVKAATSEHKAATCFPVFTLYET